MLKPSIAKKVCAGAVSLALMGAFGPAAAFANDLGGADTNPQATIQKALQTALQETSDDEDAIDLHDYHLHLTKNKYESTGKAIHPKIDEILDEDYDEADVPTDAYNVVYGKYVDGDGDQSNGYQTVDEVVEPGDYCMSLEAKDGSGYKNRVTAKFTVYAQGDLNLADISFVNDDGYDFAYTGKSINPKFNIEYNDETLTEGKDYAISYQDEDGDEVDPVDDGTYYAVITGLGDYANSQSVSKRFFINNPNDFKHASLNGVRYSNSYTGEAIAPKVSVVFDEDDGEEVDPSKYELVYEKSNDEDDGWTKLDSAPTEEGYYRVYAQALNGSGYAGKTGNEYFEIVSASDLSGADVSLIGADKDGDVYNYTGQPIKPEVEVKIGDKTLVRDQDYTLEYYDSESGDSIDNPTADGEYEAAIEGTGEYSGQQYLFFEIRDGKNLSHATVSNYWNPDKGGLPANIPYTGKPVSLGLKVALEDGTAITESTDYEVSYRIRTADPNDEDSYIYQDFDGVPSEPGSYEVVIKGISDNCRGEWSDGFNIVSDSNDDADDAASAVSDFIGTLPDTDDLTLEDANQVATARAAYDALSPDTKQAYFEDEDSDYDYRLDELKDAEAKIATLQKVADDKAAAGKVTQAIATLPSTVATDDQAQQVKNASDAYSKLTEDQKAYVPSDSVKSLGAAEAAAKQYRADKQAAADATNAINALPATVTTDAQKAQVDDAKSVFDKLTDTQKGYIDKAAKDKLDAAVKSANKYSTDKQAADAVVEAIAALPKTVATDTQANQVSKARAALNNLTADQKAYVPTDTVKALESAEAAVKQYQADQKAKKAAAKVVASINALPAKVTTAAQQKSVAAAQKAYNGLTDAQKKLVSKKAKSKLDKSVKSADKFVKDQKAKKAQKAKAAAAKKAKAAAAKKAKAAAAKKATVTVNAKTVNAKTIDKAVKKAKSSRGKVKTIVLGKNVKKVNKNAFKKYKKATTLQVKTKKLTKKSVKDSLKGSKVKTVQVKVGSSKTNKKQAKKYAKIFTKANAGKKVKVTWSK